MMVSPKSELLRSVGYDRLIGWMAAIRAVISTTGRLKAIPRIWPESWTVVEAELQAQCSDDALPRLPAQIVRLDQVL